MKMIAADVDYDFDYYEPLNSVVVVVVVVHMLDLGTITHRFSLDWSSSFSTSIDGLLVAILFWEKKERCIM